MIERYLCRTILPYFFLVWVLLTTVLLLQQSGRYADLIFGAQVSSALLFELLLALLPNVLAFTSPIALLTGIMIGFGQLRGDSELIAMRAAGVGTFRLTAPVMLLGALLSGLTFLINFEVVPESARLARGAAIRAALAKLESPLEPGVFNTEIPNHLIYAREGNREKGVWEKVFIFTPEKKGGARLVTARAGRIDASQEQSELVLSDAVVTTLGAEENQITVERVGQLRVALETGRRQLLKRLQAVGSTPEEMGLGELARHAEKTTGKERTEALVLWHRRAALGFAPIVFAWLALGLSLRFARGGRGWNTVLALLSSVLYYLFSLFAEQTARAGTLPPFVGGWIPTVVAAAVGGWLIIGGGKRGGKRFRFDSLWTALTSRLGWGQKSDSEEREKNKARSLGFGIFGLLEKDVFRELLRYFAISCLTLLFLYLIFTAFELWRFVAQTAGGLGLLGRYLLFLSPTVFFQTAPSALLLAILTTYALKAKRLEIVAWGAAGQDVLRLLLPALVFAAALGWGSWELQERVLPVTNQKQDVLRAQLRGGGIVASKEGRFWFSAPGRIYSLIGSLNEADRSRLNLKDVQIYQFGEEGIHLRNLKRAASGEWLGEQQIHLRDAEEVIWRQSFVEVKKNESATSEQVEPETADSFSRISEGSGRFSQITAAETERRLTATQVVSEQRRLRVALERKYSVVILPLAVALFASPFAFAFGRRGAASPSRPLVYAFGIWLAFIGVNAVFEQSAHAGFLPATLAVWSPLLILTSLGIYLLAKTQN